MSFRIVVAALAFTLTGVAGEAAPPVEVVNQAGPHGTAPREWLQRLSKAGAGPTRLVASGPARPRLEDLGESPSGQPLVKVYAVLTRSGDLLLPGEGGRPDRFRRGDNAKLKEYFESLGKGGAEEVTAERGKYGLTEAQFTDLFTRLQAPLGSLPEGATLRDAVDATQRAARIKIDIDPEVAAVLRRKPLDAAAMEHVASGTALAALLRQEALAMVAGRAAGLKVVALSDAKDPWPVGYDPERAPSQTVPALMQFLTVEVEGYTLAEALDAIGPRITWQDRPLPILWDRYAMRRDAIDPATTDVRFPRKRTFYKKLLDQLATQAHLNLQLRVDEAGAPLLWLTR